MLMPDYKKVFMTINLNKKKKKQNHETHQDI